jgi:hypothetical protein
MEKLDNKEYTDTEKMFISSFPLTGFIIDIKIITQFFKNMWLSIVRNN